MGLIEENLVTLLDPVKLFNNMSNEDKEALSEETMFNNLNSLNDDDKFTKEE
jgi:hypothetical protein